MLDIKSKTTIIVIMKKRTTLLQLFLYFFKVGAITFGGGYAMLGVLERDVVQKFKWITAEDMLDLIAVGESTPGAISINVATFIGYRLRGFWGSVVCTLGFMLPSLVIISIISMFINTFLSNIYISYIFKGIRAGIVIVIGSACLKFLKQLKFNIVTPLLFFTAFFIAMFTEVSVILLILGGGVFGFLLSLVIAQYRKKHGYTDDEEEDEEDEEEDY